MKKLLLIFVTLVNLAAYGQNVKITDLPVQASAADAGLVPIVISGVTKQVSANLLATLKVDSVRIINDSLFWYIANSTTKHFGGLAGGLITFNGRSPANVVPVAADYSSFYPLLSGGYVNPSWITSIPYSKLTSVPSTFAPSAHTHALADLLQGGATAGQAMVWNNTTGWTPTTLSSTTNLNNVPSPTGMQITSSSGSPTTIPLASPTNAGMMPPSAVTALLMNSYFMNDLTYDSLLTYVNDSTLKWKSIRTAASGTGVVVTPTITATTILYTITIPASNASTDGKLLSTDYARLFTRQTMADPTGTVTVNVNLGGQCFITMVTAGARTLAFSNIRAGDMLVISINNTTGGAVTLTLPSNSRVSGTGTATTLTIPTGFSKIGLAEYDATNYYFSLNTF